MKYISRHFRFLVIDRKWWRQVDGVHLYFPSGLYDFKCTPWTIVPLLAGHSSLDLLNQETYSNTKPGRGAQFLSSLNKFRSTVHSNDISYKSYYIREGFQTKKRGNFGPGPKSSKSEIQKVRSSRGYQRLKYDDSFSSYEDPIT